MATYLLASLTKSLFEQHFIPIGIVAHDQEKTEVQVVRISDIPPQYRPESEMSQEILQNLEMILRQVTEPSDQPTNLYFTRIEPAVQKDTLAEQVTLLFKEYVLPHYHR